MADIDLPSEYDVIVLGTGMTESIVAAALSRAGMTVLHLDRYDYYSADWACFHFQGLQDWIKSNQEPLKSGLCMKPLAENLIDPDETSIGLKVNSDTVRNVIEKIYIREEMQAIPGESTDTDETKTHSPGETALGFNKEEREACQVEDEKEDCAKGNSSQSETISKNEAISESETISQSETISKNEAISESETISHSETVSKNESESRKQTDCDSESTDQASDKSESTEKPDDECTRESKGNEKASDERDFTEKPGDKCTEETKNIEKSSDKIESTDKTGDEDAKESKDKDDKKSVDRRKTWTFSEMKKLWRKFNIDLMPKVLFCRGPMVELLISSDVAKYAEFRTVSRVVTKLNGKLQQVPCSRADVFGSKLVSMIEKRMMMKFLTFCMDYEKHEETYLDFKDKPFTDYLKSQKLTANIQHFIQHSIAMVTDEATTLEGLKQTQMFLQSLGRYGNTAFLWPMYGSGELPQCFCRMCAVFGGVYCLRRTAQTMLVNADNKCHAVIDTEGQKLKTKWLVLEATFAEDSLLSTPVNTFTSRAILLTDKSLNNTDSQDFITLLSLPVADLQSPVSILELPPSASCCPEGLYLLHLSCVCKDGAEQDLKPVIEDLFDKADDQEESQSGDDCKPRIQWCVYFEVADTTTCTKKPDSPDNVYIVGGPNNKMDFAYSIEKARSIFHDICPDQEFLPKAPNPEDIIWDDGGDAQTTGGGFGEDSTTEQKQATDEGVCKGDVGEEVKASCESEQASQETEKSGEKEAEEVLKDIKSEGQSDRDDKKEVKEELKEAKSEAQTDNNSKKEKEVPKDVESEEQTDKGQ